MEKHFYFFQIHSSFLARPTWTNTPTIFQIIEWIQSDKSRWNNFSQTGTGIALFLFLMMLDIYQIFFTDRPKKEENMKKSFFLLLALFLIGCGGNGGGGSSSPAPAPARVTSPSQNITGTYSLTGFRYTDLNGQTYTEHTSSITSWSGTAIIGSIS